MVFGGVVGSGWQRWRCLRSLAAGSPPPRPMDLVRTSHPSGHHQPWNLRSRPGGVQPRQTSGTASLSAPLPALRPHPMRGLWATYNGQQNHDHPYYRCRFPDEYGLEPSQHPRNVYIRESAVTTGLDQWLGSGPRRGRFRCQTDRLVASYGNAQDPGSGPGVGTAHPTGVARVFAAGLGEFRRRGAVGRHLRLAGDAVAVSGRRTPARHVVEPRACQNHRERTVLSEESSLPLRQGLTRVFEAPATRTQMVVSELRQWAGSSASEWARRTRR
jgi:hypothetical protein